MLVEEHPAAGVAFYHWRFFCRSPVQRACRLLLVLLALSLQVMLRAPSLQTALGGGVRQQSEISIRSATTSKSRTSAHADPQRQEQAKTASTTIRTQSRRGADGRVIYFLHIHKSGGSSLCKAAQRNRVVVDARHNCNVQTDARCCGGRDSLPAQQQYARTTRYGFVANERDMYEAMDPTLYRYVVTLRNSHSRYLSHYRHVVRETKWRGSFDTWYEGQPDNYAVRMICGTRCSNVSKYQITPEMFNYTLSRLDLFEDLLFVEDYAESYRHFAERVEWSAAIRLPTENMEKKGVTPSANATVFQEDFHPLMSSLDDALYEYARQKYDGVQHPTMIVTTEEALQTYFQAGPELKCASVCTCHGECTAFR